MRTETRVLSASMYELARTIQSDDGVANAAIAEAAERLDEQTVEIARLMEALKSANASATCADRMREVLDAINGALNMGLPAADVLDENSPIRDAMRDALTPNVK